MSPHEAVFGRAPTSLLNYVVGLSPAATLDDLLLNQTIILDTLIATSQRTQQRVRDQANDKRRDVSFVVDGWVFLRLQPHRHLDYSSAKP